MTTNDTNAAGVAAPCLEVFSALTPHAIVERYRNGLVALDPRVLEMDDDVADRWFEPQDHVGLWSARALLTHLMDVEILNAMRIRRVLAEENPVFENWDEHAFLDSRLSRPGPDALLMPSGACVATVHTLRQTLASMLVQLSPEDWERKAMTPYQGEVTLLDIVRYVTWHLEHHAAFLNAKVNLVLGPAAEGDTSFEGCGEGCACASQSNEQTAG
tara:strand:+ start:237 stop:881 length:645 start_codon:yes stop_codon:yes gene_type:complete